MPVHLTNPTSSASGSGFPATALLARRGHRRGSSPICGWFLSGLLVWLFMPALLPAAVPATLDSLILTGKQAIYNLDLPAAQEAFRQAQTQFPDYPQGHVHQAYITALLYALDQSNDSLDATVQRQLDAALKVSDDFRDHFPDQPEGYFNLALANSIKGMYHVLNRSYVKGYFAVRSAKKNLGKVLEKDSTCYDAYLGLGLFHYYADLLPGVLKLIAGILGFGGDRQLGLAEIRRSARQGHYFAVEGKFLYYSIRYFLEGAIDEAVPRLQALADRFPNNQGLALVIAYHYRRTGLIHECIESCRRLDDRFSATLPELTNMKYYNIAVSYYDLNQFSRADSLFDALLALPTRKSRYYRAAVAYYKGHLADLRFDRQAAISFYRSIPTDPQTQYWKWISAALLKYSTDSLLYRYFVAANLLGSREYSRSAEMAGQLMREVDAGATSPNPDLPFLVMDLVGQNQYAAGMPEQACRTFESIINRLPAMQDSFRKAYIYLHYQRCLRDLGQFEAAEKMLDHAADLDDDYTRIIVERERFILHSRVEGQAVLENRGSQ